MTIRKSSTPVNPRKAGRALERYRSKRDFQITSEPRGGEEKKPSRNGAGALPFVVQKHAATRLHYDFRLGWRGVLKSWAVAKGPSYYPGDKRLAIQVEDHPIEYGDFEGTIPKGQYGGGTVMVWDTGTWEPLGDADKGFDEGHIKFELHGKKLKGTWALVRMHGRGANPDKPSWLLIKEKDSFARDNTDPPITEEAPNSASTGRSLDQIAASADRVWNSSHEGGKGVSPSAPASSSSAASARAGKRKPSAQLQSLLKAGKKEKLPG